MKNSKIMILSCVLVLATAAAHGEAPSVDTVIERVIDAAGGREAFAGIGVLQITLEEQENLLDGTTKTNKSVAFVDTRNLGNLRLELAGDVVIARNGEVGWAEIKGEIDPRPQTPRMAIGTVNQKLLPLLLPFILAGDDVSPLTLGESTFEGKPTWKVAIRFVKDAFTSPSMNTIWFLQISQEDYTLLAAEFQPSLEIAKERNEGVRYRALRTVEVAGVHLPAEMLIDGIDRAGNETGHTRIAKLTTKVRGAWEPTLFLHPDRVKQLEEGMDP